MTTKVYSPTLPKSIPLYFQKSPEMGDPKRHGRSNYTVYGFLANAKRQDANLLKNCAAISKSKGANWHYPYQGTITVIDRLTLVQHKQLRSHLFAKLKELGISAAYTTEITRDNKLNHHLTIREAPEHLMRKNARKLRRLIGDTTTVRLNQEYWPLATFKDAKAWWRYSLKLKFSDTRSLPAEDVDALDQPVDDDIYKPKRVLFKPMLTGERLHIFGAFGDFWEQTPTQSDKLRKQKKATLQASRTARPEIEEAAINWSAITGKSAEQIERFLYDERTKATTADEVKAIDQRNEASARDYHGEEYDDHMRGKHEQRWLEEQRKKLIPKRTRKKKAPTPRKPFDPADLDSCPLPTTTYQTSGHPAAS